MRNEDLPAIAGGMPVRQTRLSYARQYIDDADITAVAAALKSDYLTCGPQVPALEQTLCDITGAPYTAAVSNGTAALHLACMAAEVQPGDEVIVPAITFAATANSALYCGARPVFADIDEHTWNVSPKSVESCITGRTKAVIAVDFMGQAAALNELSALCCKYHLWFIEDASHALGTRYDRRMVGGIADMTTFSFHAVKTATAGEGGAVTANVEYLCNQVKLLRSHGITRDASAWEHPGGGGWYYEQQALGYNCRMTDVQAALLQSQLAKLDLFSRRRKELKAFYDGEFAGEEAIILPKENPLSDTVRHLYVIRLNPEGLNAERKAIYEALQAENIGVNVHYIPVYWLPYYARLGYERGLCPNAESFYANALTLPLYYGMTDEDAADVVHAVKKIIRYYRK
jgi:UDP-4-amino-4,6-dideoxy-N-acetyl-beta-L-altrosamine transaminase